METVKELRQRLFNRAAEGLKSQGFERCMNENGNCVYNYQKNGEMRHCAFGWIVAVPDLYNSGYTAEELLGPGHGNIGNIETARDAGVAFSKKLQEAHDAGSDLVTYDIYGERVGVITRGPVRMWDNLKEFADYFKLDSSALGPRPAL